MAFTYDIATDRGKVRLLIPDRLATQYMFEDDEIDWFLTAESTVVKRPRRWPWRLWPATRSTSRRPLS